MSVDLCGGVSFLVLIVCLLSVGGGDRGAKLTLPAEFEETTLIDSVVMDWPPRPFAVGGGGLFRAVM